MNYALSSITDVPVRREDQSTDLQRAKRVESQKQLTLQASWTNALPQELREEKAGIFQTISSVHWLYGTQQQTELVK